MNTRPAYTDKEKNTVPSFFFHSDHLGSANWVTLQNASPTQFLLHLPYGEEFVKQLNGSYDERFTFTGKEKDLETGYYYFGARFDNVDLGFMSVDPMSDKYPSMSPYAYCAWNPVKYVDPEGREIWISGNENMYQYKNGQLFTKNGKLYEGGDGFVDGIKSTLDEMYSTDVGKVVINRLSDSKEKYTYKNEKCKSSSIKAGGGFVDESNNFKVMGSTKIDIAHETFHAYQKDLGMTGKTVAREIGARLFATIISWRLGPNNSWVGDQTGGFTNFSSSMMNLILNGFNNNDYESAVNSFFSGALSGPDYQQSGYTLGDILENPPIRQFLPMK